MRNKRSFDKARAYHRKRCVRFDHPTLPCEVWRFTLNPGCHPFKYTEFRVPSRFDTEERK